MSKLTFRKVNAVLNPIGYEIVQGEGYLYFWTVENTTLEIMTGENLNPLPDYTSMAVYRLNHTDIVSILEDLADKLDNSRMNSYSDERAASFESALAKVRAKIAEFSVDYAHDFPVVFLDDICPDCGSRAVCVGRYNNDGSTEVKTVGRYGLNPSSSVQCSCGRKFPTVNRREWSTRKMRVMGCPNSTTLGEFSEVWMLENGHPIPPKNSSKWDKLYQEFIAQAFDNFAEVE